MMPGGMLASLLGGVLPTGVGAGIALMFLISGILGVFVSSLVYFIPVVWNVEDILPDHIAETSSHIPEKAVDLGKKTAEGAKATAD
jgi:hypothetical protein